MLLLNCTRTLALFSVTLTPESRQVGEAQFSTLGGPQPPDNRPRGILLTIGNMVGRVLCMGRSGLTRGMCKL